VINRINILSFFLFAAFNLLPSDIGPAPFPNLIENKKEINLTSSEISRLSATRIEHSDLAGHGSGVYVTFENFHLIVTADHVTSVSDDGIFIIKSNSGDVTAKTIYKDPVQDLSVLILEEPLKNHIPIKLKIENRLIGVGEKVHYSGWPGQNDILTLEGYIAGYRKTENVLFFIVHGLAWMGSSGSGVLDDKGNLIGVIVGLGKESAPWPGLPPIAIEDIVWVTSIEKLDHDALWLGICLSNPTNKKCKNIPKKVEKSSVDESQKDLENSD